MLTEAGTAFLDRAKRILFEVENAAKELGDHPNLGRRITVGAVQTVMPYLITPLITELKGLQNNLLVNAQEDFRGNLIRAVVEGELDLAVVPLPVKDHRIAIEPLLTEPLLLVVAKNHAIASRTAISVNDLADETFVSLGDSSSLATQIRAFFGDQKFQPRIGYRCAQVATLKQFVASGLGISLLPELARQPDDRDTLTYLRLTHSELTRELVVIRHLQRYQSRGVEQFLSHLRQSVRARGEPLRPPG